MAENADNEGSVIIYAGDPKKYNTTSKIKSNPQGFFFGDTSIIRAHNIMIFSDQNLTMLGRIENSIELQDGSLQVFGSCILKDDVTKDVFRCVPTDATFTQLTNDNLIDTYNRQYSSETESIMDVLNNMPEFYSVYIQSLESIHMNGTIVGNRLGFCATNLVVGGIVNATMAGCDKAEGDGKAKGIECCNHAGGSYGGKGLPGTKIDNTIECKEKIANCSQGVSLPYGDFDVTLAFQGSGGYGESGGRGGGIIWVHASHWFHLNGTIEAEGQDSYTKSGSSYGSGGGSGGAISVTTSSISGSANSTISVRGGLSKFTGGAGGGGWIYSHIVNSTADNFTESLTKGWFGKVNVNSGNVSLTNSPKLFEDNDIHNGQISHPACYKGFDGLF